MSKAAFYLCCFAIVYPYAIYPLLLAIFTRFHFRRLHPGDNEPGITIIISAYNEESVIGAKIENTLSLVYPVEKREILVVSDCSTDRTDEIVRSYAGKGVAILTMPSRQGKTAGLNEAVKQARGEILVFSDADSMYEVDALKKMVGCFSGDESVGLVTGSTNYLSWGEGKMVVTTGMYTKLERFIKRHESALGSCVGADGAIFAMRKALYQQLRDDDINDLVLPLKVVRQGYRVIFHDNLFCLEAPAEDARGEFNRQTRITSRTLRAIFRNADLMNVFKYPLFSFEFISHKLIRLSVPLFLIALFLLNLSLLGQGVFYPFMFAAQLVLYWFAVLRYWQEKRGRGNSRLKRLDVAYHFIMVNLSMLMGWIGFIKGQKTATWEPQKQ